MSQEQPPIRSRRELRKARDAQQQAASKGTEQLPPAPNKVAAAPSGPDTAGTAAGQAPAQRSSQIRARDRATLRAIKELEEKEGQLAAGGPPTRRQLRLQQLKEQALTAANPIVPPARAPQGPTEGSRNVGSQKDVGSKQDKSQSGISQGNGPSAGGKNAGGEKAGVKNAGAGEQPVEGGKTTPGVTPGSPATQGMTVEQALAARALLAEQAKNQIAKMEHIASLDPEAVDPEILAEQIALAERAAVMNRRAMAKQKLAEQAGAPAAPAAPPKNAVQGPPRDPAKPAGDAGKKDNAGKPAGPGQRPAPSTASNLAMVTPLEFVQVPGIDRPVMKPPATSHVPVTTRPGTKVTPASTKKRRSQGSQRTAPADAGPGRSQVIARAEAAARAAARPQQAVAEEHHGDDLFEDLPRIPASSAHGLDPLDAATAGLARANRTRVLQFLILAFGIVALVSGIILIINGMSR
jgi:hypothetical protein